MSAYVLQRSDSAVAEWTAVLGEKGVAADAETIDRYSRTTQATATLPCCILYPENTEEVQALVEIASKHGIPVYTISCGHACGCGHRCAPADGAAVI